MENEKTEIIDELPALVEGEKIIREQTSDILWNKYLNLSERLKEVARLYAEGLSKADIARKLSVTRGQVSQYFYNQDLKEISDYIKSTIADVYVEETALRKAKTYLFGLDELEKLYKEAKIFDEKYKVLSALIKECKPNEEHKPKTTNNFIDKNVQFQLPQLK